MWVTVGAELLDMSTSAAWFQTGCYNGTASGAERSIKHSEVQQREHLSKPHQLGRQVIRRALHLHLICTKADTHADIQAVTGEGEKKA